VKAPGLFATSRTTHPTAQSHIQEDLNYVRTSKWNTIDRTKDVIRKTW